MDSDKCIHCGQQKQTRMVKEGGVGWGNVARVVPQQICVNPKCVVGQCNQETGK